MNLALLSAIPIALPKLLRIAVALVIAMFLLRQVHKPSRWLGRPFLWMMNKRHSALTDWGLQHVPVGKDSTILDIGCGGGRTIQKLALLAEFGKVWGIDYAKGSVAESRARNAELIHAGRIAVIRATVSNLPFAEDTFDLVTAVETQYFWPDLLHDMKEIRRVLKPGGRLIVIAEAYKSEEGSAAQRSMMRLLGAGCLSVAEHRELFSTSGYSNVQVYEEKNKGWICVVGMKAPASGRLNR